ncbi:L,D-transpeptidase [Candidatus Collierbacteria bacterium]|nr:L,D-transpeptidase [Candidatus Collierbacteria bacterium]
MTKLIFGILALVLLTGTIVNFLIWPNSYLGQTKISFRLRSQVRKQVEEALRKPIKIKLEEREFETTYSNLDISMSVDRTLAPLEKIGFGQKVRMWLSALTTPTLVQPILVFGSAFEDRVNDLIHPVEIKERVSFDKNKLAFTYISDGRAKRIDTDGFRRRLITTFGQTELVIEPTIINLKSDIEKKAEEENVLIDKALARPIEIILKKGGRNVTISLQRRDLSGLLDGADELTTPMYLRVDKGRLASILFNKVGFAVPVVYVANRIENEILARQTTDASSPVVLGDDDGPNSDGTGAEKYIEVDVSQQKMFLFENGNLLKSFRVSTGLYYPTPSGKYKIINKSTLGYSGIFDVFMPYWMAFSYAKDLGAYLGIHELPYKLSGGEKFYRFGNYIGQKKTGGCVALAPGDSREVYDFSFPNMDVLIYN